MRNISFLKKLSAYLAGAITFLATVKALWTGASSWMYFTCAAILIAGAVVFAVTEHFSDLPPLSPKHANNKEDESIILQSESAFSKVRYAEKDDEDIAFLCNRITRTELDKFCITYKKYSLWRRRNPAIFTAVVTTDTNLSPKKRLVGFFDIFPLTKSAAEKLANGTIREREIQAEDILPEADNPNASYIYIASVQVNPHQEVFGNGLAKEILIVKFAEFMMKTFPPQDGRSILAYGHTTRGISLLSNASFRNVQLATMNRQRDPLYKLEDVAYRELAEQRLKKILSKYKS